MKNSASLNNCCDILKLPLLYGLHKEFGLPLKDSKGTFNIIFRYFLPLGEVFVRITEWLSSCLCKSGQFWVHQLGTKPLNGIQKKNIRIGLDKIKSKLKKKKH
jgi:hypothetical protein